MSKKLSTEEFISKANATHDNKFDYSNTDYIKSTVKVDIVCPTHGSFQQLPADHLRGIGCKKCGHLKTGSVKRLSTEEFISKANIVHNHKFDYVKTEYVTSLKKITIICPIHGDFLQAPSDHLYGKGCLKCKYDNHARNISDDAESFIEKAKKIHGDKYDYSEVDYVDSHTNVDIKCPIHGTFTQSPSNHINNKCNCPSCSTIQTKPEKFIEDLLIKFGVFYIKNDRKLIYPKELDFHLPDHNLAIEFDGIYYHSEDSGGKGSKYHLSKTEECEKQGIHLLHIFESEYEYNKKLIAFKLRNILHLNKYKIFGRKCIVKEIDKTVKKKFINKYHIQGDTQSSIELGLFYKNRLIQVATFSKRRIALGAFNEEGDYELSRMCSVNNFNVIGGGSKLISFFERNFNPKKLTSYADRRWTYCNYNVYNKTGFSHTHNSSPNYWYFSKNNILKNWHRYAFAKHKLLDKLSVFDPSLSEWENMKNNGYDRIWDCGNMVYVKKYD